MTPAAAIDSLDRQITAHGEPVTVQRLGAFTGATQSIAQAVETRGFVRGVKADELVNGVLQTDSKVVISPTDLAAGSFTSGRPDEPLLPTVNNRVVLKGRQRAIIFPKPFYLAGELVRIELFVRG